MKKEDKKGLSEVIATLIIISISLLAIVIIWAVVQNIIKSGSQEIDIGTYTVNLEISRVQMNENGIDVTVKRSVGKGEIKDINFIISDGTNSQTFEEKDVQINELESKTFTVPYFGPVKSIALSPNIGEGSSGNLADKIDYTAKEAARNMPGLVSWWRFEGNAKDEMERNDGTVMGGSFVPGKFGQGYQSDIDGEKIIIPDDPSLRLDNSNFTMVYWIYVLGYGSSIRTAVSKGNTMQTNQGYASILINSGQTGYVLDEGGILEPTPSIINLEWAHVAISQDYNPLGNLIAKIFVNSNEKTYLNQASNPTLPPSNLDLVLSEGLDPGSSLNVTLNGIIDEVMIFNRTLSGEEINAIYNLDLNN